MEQVPQVQAQLAEISDKLSLHQDRSSWGFAQGFIIGQLSVILIVAVAIRFFIFSDASTPSSATFTSFLSPSHKKTPVPQSPEPNVSIATILEKTYYNVSTHAPESLDWFNVLIAQIISQFRDEANTNGKLEKTLNEIITGLTLPDFIDTINVTEVDIGDDFPIFSNCRIKHTADNSGLEAKIDVDLSDTLTFGVESKLLLNYPKLLMAALPVSLSVSIVRFSACLTITLIPTDSTETAAAAAAAAATTATDNNDEKKKKSSASLLFSFAPDYRLEFQIKSLIGSRSKLQDVPKVGELIESRLRKWFVDRCVSPRFQQVALPSVWPRRENTINQIHLSSTVNSPNPINSDQNRERNQSQTLNNRDSIISNLNISNNIDDLNLHNSNSEI